MSTCAASPPDERRTRARTTPAQQRWAAARTTEELLDLDRDARDGEAALTEAGWSRWAAVHDQLVLRRRLPAHR